MADEVDGWLVAFVLANQGTKDFVIVTQERYDPYIKRSVKIPNICQAFSVRCVNIFEMLIALKAKFILER
jgi:hypothetical protein